MLQTRSVYRTRQNNSNIEVTGSFLVVNCTGIQCFQSPFHTTNQVGRNDYYMIYMNQGELTLCEGGEKHVMAAGDFHIYQPHKPYYYEKTDSSEMAYLWVHFTGYGVEELLQKSGIECGEIYHTGESSVAGVTERFSRLFDVFIFDGDELEIDAAGRMMQLVAMLSGILSGSRQRQKLRRSIEYIASHYAENVTVEQLAELENLSKGRYTVLFRECFGMTPKEYVTELRLSTAEELIQHTNISIKEASAIVGYDDQNYFSRLYMRKRGFHAKDNKKGL